MAVEFAEIPSDPRLTVVGAICDADGRLLQAAYLDLRSVFLPEVHPSAWIDAKSLGVWEGEFGDLDDIHAWHYSRSSGWVTQCARGRERWFSVKTWCSWRFAFLLARLQRDVWRHQSRQPIPCPTSATLDATHRHKAEDRCTRRRIVQKGNPGGIGNTFSCAADAVLGQFEPLFSCWLGGVRSIDGDKGLNPSPFDLYALLCASHLFRHLAHSPAQIVPRKCGPRRLSEKTTVLKLTQHRPRLNGKQRRPKSKAPLPSNSPLQRAVISLVTRSTAGLAEAARRGDLDAVRFHLEVRDVSPDQALRLSVHYCHLHLVRFLYS
jgi:hypothetical protein